MAFGLSPKYESELPFEELTHEQFLTLIVEAAKQLDWDIRHIGYDGFIAYSKFSMTSWSEEIIVKIGSESAALKSECTGNQMMDWGKNRRNIESLIDAFNGLKTSLTLGDVDQKYEALKPELVVNEDGTFAEMPAAVKGSLKSVLSIFIPAKGYFITPILINLNIIVFIVMVIMGVDFLQPTGESLLQWGANFRPRTLEGEWWRLLTCCFLHIGILHLLLNMYALLYVGVLLEPYLGKLRFLAAYLLTGIAASTASLWAHEQTVSAGASGAIFGMYGVFLAMLTTNFIDKSVRKALLTSIAVFVGYNLLNGTKGGIDNAAHIGGLVSGFIIGYVYYPSLKDNDRMDIKLGSIAILSVLIIGTCGFVCARVPNYIGQYEAKMKSFVSMERMALEIYNMPKTTPRDSLLHEIKDRGIYYWNQNIDLINEADQLELPERIHDRDRALIRYCNLRIKSYGLLYKAIEGDSVRYKDSIAGYNTRIQAIIDSLK
ncbi:MAG: rhomboid family intramembrane serine protease [Bacteroidota bacterium]|nr:rhomboid family intramembrane serine protease [Bacteroidota bacterium]